jgi:hypothetical protein
VGLKEGGRGRSGGNDTCTVILSAQRAKVKIILKSNNSPSDQKTSFS